MADDDDGSVGGIEFVFLQVASQPLAHGVGEGRVQADDRPDRKVELIKVRVRLERFRQLFQVVAFAGHHRNDDDVARRQRFQYVGHQRLADKKGRRDVVEMTK